MTNEEFCKAHIGERVIYKGKDIGAYVAGYVDKKYIILGFDNFDGCRDHRITKAISLTRKKKAHES